MNKKFLELYETLPDEGKKIFEKLPEQRQELVAAILGKIERGRLFWEKEWLGGQMNNPVTKVTYRGVNSLYLAIIAEVCDYADCRWVTFKQMKDKKWCFKKDKDGNSLGKKAGVKIEFFDFYDTKTKKLINWGEYNKLSSEEQNEYWNKYIKPCRKTHTVFNCSLMDGVPALNKTGEKAKINEKAERIIAKCDSPISYDGNDSAYYRLSDDTIHLPLRESFISYETFLGTALHEIGHSTGHSSRLNRDMSNEHESYAKEELNAELYSMFQQQSLNVKMSDKQLENHSAYLQHWGDKIRSNPNYLFRAIAEAQKMVSFVNEKYLGLVTATDAERAALNIDTKVDASDSDKKWSKQFLEQVTEMNVHKNLSSRAEVAADNILINE